MSSPTTSGIMFGNDADEFVDVVFNKPPPPHKPGHGPKGPKDKSFYESAVENTSAPWSFPIIANAGTLRKLYPKHSLVMTRDSSCPVLNVPGAVVEPFETDKAALITNVWWAPMPKSSGVPGVLVDSIDLGAFNISWQGYDFIVYVVTVPIGMGTTTQTYILHEGPEEPARFLIMAAGAWTSQLHNEIWVYDSGWWQKSGALWDEVQKANWADVILKEDFKQSLQKDVFGFFSSEKIYKDLGIPWKRGLILYGPPGNGKTISIKAIMKYCDEKGYSPLYVKSFRHWAGEEAAMTDVFDKARQLSPSVIILEDLDSLINDQNRSFFLNQVDGLHGNDGLLLIGTTNHFDRLDPGLSTRPSRFDRKYNFEDPDLESRKLYIQYWQKKLAGNEEIDFPDQLVQELAELTDKFSFAYLKEAFVSTLVILAGIEGKKPPFASAIKREIAKLSEQLDKQSITPTFSAPSNAPARPPRPDSATERDLRAVLDALSESPARRAYDPKVSRPSEGSRTQGRSAALLDALESLQTSDFMTRRYETVHDVPTIPAPFSASGPLKFDGTDERVERLRAYGARQGAPLANSFQTSSGHNYTQSFGGSSSNPFQSYPRSGGSANFPVRFHPNHPQHHFG